MSDVIVGVGIVVVVVTNVAVTVVINGVVAKRFSKSRPIQFIAAAYPETRNGFFLEFPCQEK